MKYSILISYFILIGHIHFVKSRGGLNEIFSWKYLDFVLPSNLRTAALASRSLIPENNVPLGFTIWRDKMFVSITRWTPGVGSALNYINLTTTVGKTRSPHLIPYPSVEDNFVNEDPNNRTVSLPSQKSIISVSRTWADKCDRLWVIDYGAVDLNGENRIIAPPAIVIFNLKTDALIRRFSIPAGQTKTDSFWANIQVDVEKNSCDDAYAYVTDLLGMVVYSLKGDVSWRVNHNFFGDDPFKGNYFIKGVNNQWTDGLFGMVIANKRPNGSRRVYFHSLSSTKQFYVSNTVLKNQTYIAAGKFYYDFKYVGDRGSNTQSTRSFFDPETNVIFYPMVQKYGVACWNTDFPLKRSTYDTAYQNEKTMIFPNDLSVDKNRDLWVMSNSLTIFLYGNWNTNIHNIRIHRGSVTKAIKGTKCQ